jgi:hypothetical protein
MKAAELLRRRIPYSVDSFAELVLWQLPQPLPGSQHSYKYRLAYAVHGVCVLRYDNESGKGDHHHDKGNNWSFNRSANGWPPCPRGAALPILRLAGKASIRRRPVNSALGACPRSTSTRIRTPYRSTKRAAHLKSARSPLRLKRSKTESVLNFACQRVGPDRSFNRSANGWPPCPRGAHCPCCTAHEVNAQHGLNRERRSTLASFGRVRRHELHQRGPWHYTLHLRQELALAGSLRGQVQTQVSLLHGSDTRCRIATAQAGSTRGYADLP